MNEKLIFNKNLGQSGQLNGANSEFDLSQCQEITALPVVSIWPPTNQTRTLWNRMSTYNLYAETTIFIFNLSLYEYPRSALLRWFAVHSQNIWDFIYFPPPYSMFRTCLLLRQFSVLSQEGGPAQAFFTLLIGSPDVFRLWKEPINSLLYVRASVRTSVCPSVCSGPTALTV